jgi:hypothetical protein
MYFIYIYKIAYEYYEKNITSANISSISHMNFIRDYVTWIVTSTTQNQIYALNIII